ncbi:MAG: TlpA family protein disulfide reductase [Bdellovibrio sp.]|nr:TlpA family protein disulfide reductase [Bdellovibrio sp.]
MTTAQKSNTKQLKLVLLPIFLILLVITASLFFVKYRLVDHGRSDRPQPFTVGKVLPDFALTDLNGKKIRVSTVQGKVIFMNFWATWCEACLEEMPSIVKLREKFHSKGLEVVAINLDENPAAVVPRTVQRYQMDFPVFQDPNGEVAELFDVYAIPLTVVMNNKREILHIQNGENDWNTDAVHTQMRGWLGE